MTKIEEGIVRFITGYCKRNRFYPNYDEIAKGVGRAKATIHVHMKKLENEGVIIRKSEGSSQYRLTNMDVIFSSGEKRDVAWKDDLISRSALTGYIEEQYRQWGDDYDALQILSDIRDMPAACDADRTVEGYADTKTIVHGMADRTLQEMGIDLCIECMLITDGEYEGSVGLEEFVDQFYSNIIQNVLNVVAMQGR